MPWVITNGKNYLKKKSDGTPVATRELHEATRFDDCKKANNFCNCLPKSMKHLGYYASHINAPSDTQPVQIPSAPKKYDISEPPTHVGKPPKDQKLEINQDLLEFDTFVGKIQDFSNFVSTAVKQRPILVEAQLRTELEIMDIEHAAEFYNWNAAKGYKAFRMLRDARIRRRKYKDAIQWIDALIEANPSSFISANVPKKLNDTQQREYHPRVFPELFAEGQP